MVKYASARKSQNIAVENPSFYLLRSGAPVNRQKHSRNRKSKLGNEHHQLVKGQRIKLGETALTRLADAGCDAFTLARIAGHSSITITQRYCHPQADAIERVFAKLTDSEVVVTDGGQHGNRSEVP